MREFGVTSEEYDKLYDVFALRARRYEKIIGEKVNKAKEFYWSKKLKSQSVELSERRKAIEKTVASSKKISKSEEDKANKAYIDLHFLGFIQKNQQLQSIYYDTSLTWRRKRELIEEWFKKREEQRKQRRERSGDEPYEPYEESDGTTGYEAEYEL